MFTSWRKKPVTVEYSIYSGFWGNPGRAVGRGAQVAIHVTVCKEMVNSALEDMSSMMKEPHKVKFCEQFYGITEGYKFEFI